MRKVVFEEQQDVQARLAELGLEGGPLMEVVQRGYIAFSMCTENDPPLFPGFSAWAQTVRALREYLVPRGWRRCDENNYSLVVSPDDAHAIAVATGDDGTGRSGFHPSTKSSKGPSTADAIITNQMQLSLPLDLDVPHPFAGDAESNAERLTWILLVYRGAGEVRSELSLPSSMGTDGRIESWQERIILGAMPTDPIGIEITPPSPVLPDIEVSVKRRS